MGGHRATREAAQGEATRLRQGRKPEAEAEHAIQYSNTPDPYARGDVPVFILKEDQPYPTTPGIDEIPFKNVGNFLRARFEQSLEQGINSFQKTVDHYEKVLLGAASPVGEFNADLKNLFAEARGIKSKDELRQFWKNVTDYHAAIELVKPKK